MSERPQYASNRLGSAGREAILTSNALLSGGSIIAPTVAAATNFAQAAALCIVFSLVTYITVTICSFVPRRIVYTVRIILYTLVASLVYVPVSILMENIMPASYAALGIYAPLLITNSMITLKTELKFYRLKRGYMLELAAFYVLGYDIALMLFGIVREIITNGGLLGVSFIPLPIPTASTVFGGFILLAVMSALFRWIVGLLSKREQKT